MEELAVRVVIAPVRWSLALLVSAFPPVSATALGEEGQENETVIVTVSLDEGRQYEVTTAELRPENLRLGLFLGPRVWGITLWDGARRSTLPSVESDYRVLACLRGEHCETVPLFDRHRLRTPFQAELELRPGEGIELQLLGLDDRPLPGVPVRARLDDPRRDLTAWVTADSETDDHGRLRTAILDGGWLEVQVPRQRLEVGLDESGQVVLQARARHLTLDLRSDSDGEPVTDGEAISPSFGEPASSGASYRERR
ncbi:MAG: hypothetical protein AAF533_06595 [Acidobacteriota bacterium]